jgi:aprataxin
MSRKHPRPTPVKSSSISKHFSSNPFRPKGTNLPTGDVHFPGRSGLEAYLASPETFPASQIISYNDDWVLIRDRYPKASVHLLLMPRDLKISHMHPYDALRDPAFLESATKESAEAARLAASELRRQYGSGSAAEQSRNDAMDADEPPLELPPGRDWLSEILVGVHTHPSMSNLHIHIVSRDMHSPCMKHRKHYNSFNTDFFVKLDECPLSEDEQKRRYELTWPGLDMRCWRCGRNFGNAFKRLKEHLEREWDEWQRE